MLRTTITIGKHLGKIYVRGAGLTFVGLTTMFLANSDKSSNNTITNTVVATVCMSSTWFVTLPIMGSMGGSPLTLCAWILLIVIP